VITPLLDYFRRGEVAVDLRLLAAQGAVAPRAHEQLALLILLAQDADERISAAAEDTIARIPSEALKAFLARPDAAEFHEFFAERGIGPAETPAAHCDEPLIDTGPEPPAQQKAAPSPQNVSLLGISERIALAMKGTRECRAVLIRDPNKLVAAAVLSSPKVTESEVEAYARMANLSEEVLRIIGTTRTWVRNYAVASGLARNPKTPLAISLNLLNRLHDRDLKLLSLDRNVPEPLRIAARKRVVADASHR
jgi:voltage-gated potassium channel Kch